VKDSGDLKNSVSGGGAGHTEEGGNKDGGDKDGGHVVLPWHNGRNTSSVSDLCDLTAELHNKPSSSDCESKQLPVL
ncbi:hypothetical protein Q5P01_000232, partial [Channa striata]